MIRITGEIHSSKNSRELHRNCRSGRIYFAKSDASKADEVYFDNQLRDQRAEWERMTAGREYPLYVTFAFTRKTRGRWDFLNIAQGVADAMVKAGYLPDDDVDHFIPVWGGYQVDKHNPGCEFWIE